MHCCVCNVTCMHVGPHSYCWAHDPSSQYAPTTQRDRVIIYPTTGTQQFTLSPVTSCNHPCNHCWCETDENNSNVPHAKCCKCEDVMAEKFLP